MTTSAPKPGPELVRLFGPDALKGISGIANDFDFQKIDITNPNTDDYLHVGLAPSFGKLDVKGLHAFDEAVKVMIAGTMRQIEKVPEAERTFMKMREIMTQSPLLERAAEPKVVLPKQHTALEKEIQTDNPDKKPPPPKTTPDEVQTWFSDIVGNAHVVDETHLDLSFFGTILGKLDNLWEFFSGLIQNKYFEKPVVDVGVLRFPQPDSPTFKLYHIKVTAWAQEQEITVVRKLDSSGIAAEYEIHEFKPRASMIKDMSKEARDKATKEADELLVE